MFGIFQCILRKDGGISLPERMRAELEGKPLCGWVNQDEGRTVRVGVRTVILEREARAADAPLHEVTLSGGRLLLPPPLLGVLTGRDLVLVGAPRLLEIWTRDRWEKVTETILSRLE